MWSETARNAGCVGGSRINAAEESCQTAPRTIQYYVHHLRVRVSSTVLARYCSVTVYLVRVQHYVHSCHRERIPSCGKQPIRRRVLHKPSASRACSTAPLSLSAASSVREDTRFEASQSLNRPIFLPRAEGPAGAVALKMVGRQRQNHKKGKTRLCLRVWLNHGHTSDRKPPAPSTPERCRTYSCASATPA